MFKKISNIFKRQSYDIIKLHFNTFGEKLLIEICEKRGGNENISVTPPIILLAFYMLLLGPDTKTKRQLEKQLSAKSSEHLLNQMKLTHKILNVKFYGFKTRNISEILPWK